MRRVYGYCAKVIRFDFCFVSRRSVERNLNVHHHKSHRLGWTTSRLRWWCLGFAHIDIPSGSRGEEEHRQVEGKCSQAQDTPDCTNSRCGWSQCTYPHGLSIWSPRTEEGTSAARATASMNNIERIDEKNREVDAAFILLTRKTDLAARVYI